MKNCILLGVILVMAEPGRAEVIYVNHAAAGNNDGSDWENAYNDLQSALTAAQAHDEIWVCKGLYVPTQTSDRSASFVLRDSVRLYGGFLGTEVDASQRQWRLHRSVLTGNIGDPGMVEDNSYRVVQCEGVSALTVLDGFTITAAFNDQGGDDIFGGGLTLERSEVIVANCKVIDNYAHEGGGIFARGAPATFLDCMIVRNQSVACVLVGSSSVFIDCTFRRNRANRGGALNTSSESDVTVVQCSFIANRAYRFGGAYYGFGNPRFESCLFARNRALTTGAYGGAMLLREGSARIVNCTIVKNWSGFNSGGITTFSPESQPVIRNCVVWGNRSVNGDRHGWIEENQVLLHAGTMKQCLIEAYTGLYGGRSNFDADPMFVNVEARNYRLRAGSPCIDRGKDDAVLETQDLDGNPRILSGRVDLGAYESVCDAIRDFDVDARDNDSGGFDVLATLKTHLPSGSTVRVVFTPLDENGDPLEPRTRRARIMEDGRGKATLPDCPSGRTAVCVEGCGESFCREVECP